MLDPLFDSSDRTAIKLYGTPSVTSGGGLNGKVRSDGLPEAIDLDQGKGGDLFKLADRHSTAGTTTSAVVAPNDDIRKQARNDLQSLIKTQSDNICSAKIAQIKGTGDAIHGGLNSLTTILGGAGAIVTGVTAARVLAGTASITSGVHGNISQAVYQDFVTAAIPKAIKAGRETMWSEIETKRTKEISTYGVYEAIQDVSEYHNLCSFAEGLAALTKASEKLAPSELTTAQGIAELELFESTIDKNQAKIDDIRNNKIPAAVLSKDDKLKASLQQQLIELEALDATLQTRRRIIANRMTK